MHVYTCVLFRAVHVQVSLVKNGSFTIDFEVDGEDHYDVFFVTVDGEKVMQHVRHDCCHQLVCPINCCCS